MEPEVVVTNVLWSSEARYISAISNYETDVYEWTKEEADALRRRAPNKFDGDNLAEEIESLGVSNRLQVKSRLEILISHLLKWKYQPKLRCGSWRGSILGGAAPSRNADRGEPLSPSPSPEYLPRAYICARLKALAETELYDLPETCPWTIVQILNGVFLP